MKENIREFFQTKKELLVFIALLLVTFVTVIAIAEVALFNDRDDIVVNPSPEDPDLDGDEDITPPTVTYKFNLPVSSSYVLVRTFYDMENPANNKDAIIETNGGFIESNGLSFAKEDNSTFDVLAIYPGTVLSVEEDDSMGTTITIDHGNDLISTYSALSSTTLNKGDTVDTNAIIGKSGTSVYDVKAGNHVHVQVISTIDGKKNFINLNDIVGKTLDDIASSVK